MLLSIDPGINNCGMVVIDYSDVFTVLETMNICNERRFTVEEKEVGKTFGLRAVKIATILEQVKLAFIKYPHIDYVVIEAPFYNPGAPNAYSSLLEIISAIKHTILLPNKIRHSLVAPLLIKRVFLNIKLSKELKKKEAMRALLVTKVSQGEIVLPCEVEVLSEHEIDAIAVGYSHAISQTLIKLEEEQLVKIPKTKLKG